MCTEWTEFRELSGEYLQKHFKGKFIFDGKNFLDGAEIASKGFKYFGVGFQPKNSPRQTSLSYMPNLSTKEI